MQARQWLIENGYKDIASLIDEIMDEWKKKGIKTRRNWWEILAGDVNGSPRQVAGREFPVLQTARKRQGLKPTKNSICRNKKEKIPEIRETGRW